MVLPSKITGGLPRRNWGKHGTSTSGSAMSYAVTFADSGELPSSERMQAKNYAPHAPSLNTSDLKSADNSVFLELPVGWYGDWHPTPVRQWLILMSGACEFEAGDESVRITAITRSSGTLCRLAHFPISALR